MAVNPENTLLPEANRTGALEQDRAPAATEVNPVVGQDR
jgi:hypothetical protein